MSINVAAIRRALEHVGAVPYLRLESPTSSQATGDLIDLERGLVWRVNPEAVGVTGQYPHFHPVSPAMVRTLTSAGLILLRRQEHRNVRNQPKSAAGEAQSPPDESTPVTRAERARRAAIAASPSRMAVLAALAAQPGTDFDLAHRTGLSASAAGKRRGELQLAGMAEPIITADGRAIQWRTPQGTKATTWVCTAAGRKLLQEHPHATPNQPHKTPPNNPQQPHEAPL